MDVVALGESMVTFLPGRPGRLADVPSFDRAIGGAESNVACVLAAAGHTARWVGRVGADGFGDHLVERIAGYGVDVSSVERDPARPTGVYFRTAGDRGTGAHEVAYYRAGSAASAMSVADVDLAAVRAGRVLHLSGITAALSEDCRALMHTLTARHPGRPLLSFDVNHRPALWPTPEAPLVLLDLARRADIVFVGEDEAEQAWGVTGGPEAIRRALPEPGVLVVKQGRRGATAFERDRPGGDRGAGAEACGEQPGRSGVDARGAGVGACGGQPGCPGAGAEACGGQPGRSGADVRGAAPVAAQPTRTTATPPRATFEPAPTVDVVATTGAGDAFAAGFLHGTLRNLPLATRLRLGHLFAAATLTTPADLATPPARDHADRLSALDDTAWGRLRLAPGWTQAEWHEEEANTP
ncbi:sugar kinase [Streptomyces sp. NPDC049099]|uniref:sugar kinase n=1 Tax=Streptomyces sp. NPDC049099 TaxID=3155768 RepID=UPI003419CB77